MDAKSSSMNDQKLVKILTSRPPVHASAETIDFKEVGLSGYDNHFAILINDLFTKSECETLLEGAETSSNSKWDQAMINVGNGQQMLSTDVRLCDRILWDNYEVAAKVLDRVKPYLPADVITLKDKPLMTGRGPAKRKEAWQISRINERLRFLRYTKGMYFRTHCDGSYVTPDGEEISFLTIHIYLNGDDDPPAAQWGAEKDEDKPLLGGATRFLGPDWEQFWDVNPRVGSVLVFQHRNLLHSGEDVRQGTKYTLRSDIMYHRVEA